MSRSTNMMRDAGGAVFVQDGLSNGGTLPRKTAPHPSWRYTHMMMNPSATLEPVSSKPVSSNRPHINIRALPPNSYVDGVYGLFNPQIGTTRGGKPYLKCLLRDATGEVSARLWTFETANFPELERTAFVW